MKYFISSIAIIFLLAGCGGGGGGGNGTSAAFNFCATSQNQAAGVFAASKVQVNMSAQAKNTNPLTLDQIGMSVQAPTATTISSGSSYVAVMKESCIAGATQTPSGVRSVRWTAPQNMTVDQLTTLVNGNDCIVGLSDEVKMKALSAYTDPDVPQQTHLASMRSPAANNIFYSSSAGITKDVVVAVIDTGVDTSHQDLQNLWVNASEIPNNQIDDEKNGYVDDVNGWDFPDNTNTPTPKGGWSGNEHGTHVSGLAAAQGNNGVGVSGVMGIHVKIMPLNVFGGSSGASSIDIDNAIRYAADNGAEIINMSLGGGGQSSATGQAIQYAISKGVTVFAAAGNNGSFVDTSTNFFTPASYSGMMSGMLAVASVDVNNFALSYFSDYGTGVVKVAAPGSDSQTGGLLSTLPGNTYGRMQGTSMASPVAAGAGALVVGLMKSRGRRISPSTVENELMKSGQLVASLANDVQGGKVINLQNLAQSVDTDFPSSGPGPGDAANCR